MSGSRQHSKPEAEAKKRQQNRKTAKAESGKSFSKGAACAVFAGLLILAVIFSLFLGRYRVTPGEVFGILFKDVIRGEKYWSAAAEAAILNLRLPRIFLACLVGCALSAAGTVYQGIFMNPLASPDILGATNGAAFGAALAILLGAQRGVVTLCSFALGGATLAVVFAISAGARGKKVMTLILAGIMVSSLASAGTSFIKLVADPSNKLPAITYWLMGSLSGVEMKDVCLAAVPIILGTVPLIIIRWRLNLLTLGDEEARALGVNAPRLRILAAVCATLISASCVAVCGPIGWVGLVIPHLARRFTGNDFRHLLPLSMIMGALYLLVIDDLSRNLLATEIPIGILTALVGAPFFIWLIMRREQV